MKCVQALMWHVEYWEGWQGGRIREGMRRRSKERAVFG